MKFFTLLFFLCIPYTLFAQETKPKDDAGLMGGISGFFETSNPINFPTGASSWWHLLDVRHSTLSNNFAMQLAGSFFDQNFYLRKTANNAQQPWVKIVTESNGKVGIGTFNPQSVMHLYQSAADEAGLIVQGSTINGDSKQHYVAITLDGDYGNGTGNYSQIRSYSNLYDYWGSRLAFFTTSSSATNSLIERMRIDANGNVGIGTVNPEEKLTVNGKIKANEIRVNGNGAPDYVFEEGYHVGTLEELEGYIKANKHLPEVPSAKEFERDGIALGEINKLLLKKVEELTLHLIEKDKELSQEKELNKMQNDRLKNIETKLDVLLKKNTQNH
ncbi:tail fiber protein [Pedobacter miscanthi]|uniref:tail fiber protein n=1 Tax=Pedobacter miscanthi TaxID=2259170 RepID=UPI00292F6ED9|nr:tail fiber protein [Pedobacter miscanthi]